MPITRDKGGSLDIVCINGCTPPHGDKRGDTKGFDYLTGNAPVGTTMHTTPGWHALMVAHPPQLATTQQPPGSPPPGRIGPRFVSTSGAPVQLYICEVCGYVEMYAAVVHDPDVWGPDG